jgi:hypothetical protein
MYGSFGWFLNLHVHTIVVDFVGGYLEFSGSLSFPGYSFWELVLWLAISVFKER